MATVRARHAGFRMTVVTSGRESTMMMQILIVENDTNAAMILKDLVEIDRFHTVIGIASDLDAALASIEECPPPTGADRPSSGGERHRNRSCRPGARTKRADALHHRQPVAIPGPRAGTGLPVQTLQPLQRLLVAAHRRKHHHRQCGQGRRHPARTRTLLICLPPSASLKPKRVGVSARPMPFCLSDYAFWMNRQDRRESALLTEVKPK